MSAENTAALSVQTFEPIRARFEDLVKDPQAFAKEASFALQILGRNDYLAKSSKQSLQMAVLNVANIGLSLNPVLKLAYLVPRWNRSTKSVECALEPSYQGLVKLLTDTKSIVNVEAQIIWEGDEVVLDMATAQKVVKHVPYVLTQKEKGKMLGVYSLATLHDGSRTVEVMSAAEVYEVRGRSESWQKFSSGEIKSCVWHSDEGEMSRKTVIRRHFKYLPKSDAFERVAEAVKLDEEDYPCSMAQWAMVDRLLHTAHIPEDKKAQIEKEMGSYTNVEASMAIEYLQQNQPQDHMKALGEQVRQAARA